jgi:hypothetical protein
VSTAALDSLSTRGVVPRWLRAFTAVGGVVLLLGGQWDFSWHRSIGRDTFFTPPHVVVYLGALASCLAAAGAILHATFTGSARNRGVRVWGFEAPVGAFVVAWGGLAMLAGGVFDNWWHGVYGLDIVIQSVPHVIILTGLLTILGGNLLLAVSHANDAPARSPSASALVVLAGGLVLGLLLAMNLEELFVYLLHGARAHCIVALAVPLVVFGVGGATGERFGATYVALVYSVLVLVLIAVLPLVPAEPRLGPVLHRVSHFVPPPFPLLVAPAAALVDLVSSRFSERGVAVRSIFGGSLFFGAFVLFEWPFASFLQSPAARNRLFAGNEFAFFQAEGSLPLRHLFYPTENTPAGFWSGMALALGLAVLSTRLGLAVARWLGGVRR